MKIRRSALGQEITYNKRVPLSWEDLQRVNTLWLGADRVSHDDCHIVVVDAKDVRRVARHGHKPEAVA